MRRLLITAALLTALGETKAALTAGASPITAKLLGTAGIAQRLAVQGPTGRIAHIAEQ
jgi:hypothetical protein